MLTVAAILCDAGAVLGVDVDEDALETCRMNLESFDPAMEAELAPPPDAAVGVSTRRRAKKEEEEGEDEEEEEGEEEDAGRATSRSTSMGKTDRRPPPRAGFGATRCDESALRGRDARWRGRGVPSRGV